MLAVLYLVDGERELNSLSSSASRSKSEKASILCRSMLSSSPPPPLEFVIVSLEVCVVVALLFGKCEVVTVSKE